MELNWQKPNKPAPHQGGLVVLHSDDGRMADIEHFVPTIMRAINKNNQFNTKNTCIFSPAVNSGYMAGGYERQYDFKVMQPEHLHYIVDNGGEIVSHNKYHVWLSYTPVTQTVNSGATRIYYNEGSWARFMEGLTFFIEEGNISETFTVTNVVNGGNNDNYIDIVTPLKNSYTISARLHITEETAHELFGGNINLLASHGIECKHQVNPWYTHSPLTRTWLEQYFESVVTGGGVVDPNNIDLYDLKRTRDIRYFDEAEMDGYLTSTRDNNTVLFVQAHGMPDDHVKVNFEYLIKKAYELGLKIVTHSEAVAFLKTKM